MKHLFVFSLATFLITGCCSLIKYDPVFPILNIELRNKDSGEDLFVSGQLSVDSINITNVDFPDQHFGIQEQANRTIISFGPSQQEYTISAGVDVIFDILTTETYEEKRCYTSTTITSVSVTPYDFEAIDGESKEWSIIVWVN